MNIINTAALRLDWDNLTWDKQEKIRGQILTTRIRKWRNKNVKSNKLLYHTKRNGVGIMQGFCECIDEEIHPCKIIVDLLDISPKEIEYWKTNGEWPWMAINKKPMKTKLKTKQNYEYERQEIELCEKMRNMAINSKAIQKGENTPTLSLIWELCSNWGPMKKWPTMTI